MIRFATLADVPTLKQLWLMSFDDSDAYVDGFMSSIGRVDRCLVWEEDSTIVSMLFLLPAIMVVGKEQRDLVYVYACATRRDRQRRGCMGLLLEFAFQWIAAKGGIGLVLIPASEELSTYYRRQGFIDFTTKPTFDSTDVAVSDLQLITDDLMEQIISLRRSEPSEGSVHWSDDYLRFALQDFADNGGRVIVRDEEYLLVASESLRIKERLPFSVIPSAEVYTLIRPCGAIPSSKAYFNWGLD